MAAHVNKQELIHLLIDELSSDDLFTQSSVNQYTVINSVVPYTGLTVGVLPHLYCRVSARIEGYVDEIVPLYSNIDFKSHFRMLRGTFEELCKELAPELNKERTLSVEKKLLSTLWLLGNQESYRSVADRFGLNKGNLHRVVMSVCQSALKIMEKYIKFPATQMEMEAIAGGFRQRCQMPGVIGAVDGTHIAIPAPKSIHRSSYINRKGYSSTVLQVVCDSYLNFIDVYAGWPGSVHDARVYRHSPLSKKVEQLPEKFHLLGDSAYPLSNSLLVPFRDNGHLSHIQKHFNHCHSSTRVDVERAIGLLKCKFRRLKFLDMTLESEIPNVIITCCILHNFILKLEKNDFLEEIPPITPFEQELPVVEVASREREAGDQKRRLIAESLI